MQIKKAAQLSGFFYDYFFIFNQINFLYLILIVLMNKHVLLVSQRINRI